MTTAFLFAVGVVTFSPAVSALSVCSAVPQSVSALIAAGGCSFGADTFTNFDLTGSSGVAAAINPANIGISINQVGTTFSLVLAPLNATWSVTGFDEINLHLSYIVTGPAWFTGFGASLQGSSVFSPGSVGLTKIINPAGNSQSVNANMVFPTSALVNFTGAPLSSFVVSDVLQVAADSFHVGQGTGSASVGSATNIFVVAVPEPMTSMLLPSGLFAIGLLLRRKRTYARS
jgi:hypothetical protein